MSIDARAMVGGTLTAVSSSWHEFEGRRSATPVHVWLHLGAQGTLRLHTLDGLVIAASEVDQSYEMGENGRLVVEDSGPTVLMERIGGRIEAVSRLHVTPPGAIVGLALHFQSELVGIGDFRDDLIVAPWPGENWERFNVSVLPH